MRLLSLVFLAACSSSSPSLMMDAPQQQPPQAARTSPGTPTGTAATQMVGPDGGTVTSADGLLDVAIPAGAFAAPTAVTIQPITNTLPNGVGLAYRLSPEGTTFAMPATLAFHVDPTNLAASFVATQHADGTWWSQPMQTRDASATTVSLPAPHFSDWALAQTLLVLPHTARVRTNATQDYAATVVVAVEDGDDLANPDITEEDEVSTTQAVTTQLGATVWSVNATPGGSPDIGLVSDEGGHAMFTAPANPPIPSTVAVSLTAKLGTMQVIATASAEIVGQEIWMGYSDVTQVDGTVVHADVTFVETADSTGTMVHFDVMTGTAHVTPAQPVNCTLTVTPDTSAIGPHDGSMLATYDLATGPDSPHISGAGQTVWVTTYNLVCPNGPSSMPSSVSAPWWPSPSGMMPPVNDADDGVLDATVSSQLASGTIHLVRQP